MNLAKLASPPPAALREGITILRKVIQSHPNSAGFTTSELYQLAVREPSSPTFANAVRNSIPLATELTGQSPFIKPIPKPPHPEHPISSKTFLKKAILPILEGKREIQLVRTTRTPTRHSKETPLSSQNKSSNKIGTKQSGPLPTTSSATVWLWKPVDASKIAAPLRSASSISRAEAEAPVQDWGHLSKRRRASRIAKLALGGSP